MPTYEDLDDEAQDRVQDWRFNLAQVQNYANENVPQISAITESFCSVILKLVVRAEHAEMRLRALEGKE